MKKMKETWERKLRNKKGAIGATLTWMVAAFVILFILVIFIALTLALSFVKDVTEVKPEASTKIPLLSSITLTFVMNMPTELNGEQMAMKELISNWALGGDEKMKDEIEKKIKEKLDSLLEKDEGYLFYVAYSEKGKEITEGVHGGGLIEIYDAEDYVVLDKNFELHGVANEAKAALENALTLYLIPDKKVKIKLYIGKTR